MGSRAKPFQAVSDKLNTLWHTMAEGRALKRNASQEAEQVVQTKEPGKEEDIFSMEEDEKDEDESTPPWARKMTRDMGKILGKMTTVRIRWMMLSKHRRKRRQPSMASGPR